MCGIFSLLGIGLIAACADAIPTEVAEPVAAPSLAVSSGSIAISRLNVVSGERYVVVSEGLREGANPYIDRPYIFRSVPDEVRGLTYIRTANDDQRSRSEDELLTFSIDRDAAIYVAHDDPDPRRWLQDGFTDTGLNLYITKKSRSKTLNLFKKSFSAGVITLGGNREGSSRADMYSVIIEPTSALRSAPSPGEVASVTVSPRETSIGVGETAQLVATVRDANGTALKGRTVSWSSSNPGVTTVTSTGRVTGVAAGSATILAISGGQRGSVSVTVSAAAANPAPPPPGGDGIWISPDEIAKLPTSGAAWNNVKKEADSNCGSVDLSDQEDPTNVCIMAKALVFARTGGSSYRGDVVKAIDQINNMGRYNGRALALGRELGAYVIAADLIDLKSFDPKRDSAFRSKLRELRIAYAPGGGVDNLIECHEQRPNNWGNHCGATRAAIAAYLGDKADLDRTAKVFKGYLGDRSSYAGFKYGSDLTWQCDRNKPVGINPKGCVKNGQSLDGVLPDDQRRGGSFQSLPVKENYVWEGLQGAHAQAVILSRQGDDVWNWEDKALLRAVTWLHEKNHFPAASDDTWQPHVTNYYYGKNFPAPVPARSGKNIGWTDWTHGSRR